MMLRPFARGWLLPVGMVALLAVHIVGLYHLSSSLALSAVFVAAVIALVAIKHVGLFAALYSSYRQRLHRDRDP